MLRGRRFAMNPVGQTGYLAALFLKRYGLKLTDVEVCAFRQQLSAMRWT
jgi:hypothetical protein